MYILDRYRSICSATLYKMSIRDYFVASNGAVYDAIQAAYIVLRIMGYFMYFMPTKYYHFACFRLSTYLYVLFVYVSVCASVQLEMHWL